MTKIINAKFYTVVSEYADYYPGDANSDAWHVTAVIVGGSVEECMTVVKLQGFDDPHKYKLMTRVGGYDD